MVSPRIGRLRSLFEDDVVHAFEFQIVADRKTSLSASDDDGSNSLITLVDSWHEVAIWVQVSPPESDCLCCVRGGWTRRKPRARA
jgi:hypothetical protein